MYLRTKPSNSPCHSKALETGGTEDGYALLIVMMMAAIMLVLLTAALPSIYQEGQREREEELIFRGMQYARAIALFRRQFNRFPTDVKELLQTNGIRFLRQAYPDPMSRKGKWRFIHASAAGVLLDSKLRGPTPGTPGALGTPGTPGTSGGFSQTPAGSAMSNPGSQQSSAFFGEGNEVKGAFIVGVASTSRRKSIRVWNKRTHYDEWEFLSLETNPLLSPGGVPGQTAPPGRPGLGGQPSQFGQPSSMGSPMTPMQPMGSAPQQ